MRINLTNVARHDKTFIRKLDDFSTIFKKDNEKAAGDAVGSFNLCVNDVNFLQNIIDSEANNNKIKALCESIYSLTTVANPLETVSLYAKNTTLVTDEGEVVPDPSKVNLEVSVYTSATTPYLVENFIFDVVSLEEQPKITNIYAKLTYSTYLNVKDTVLVNVEKVNLTSLSIAGKLCLSLNDLDMIRSIELTGKMLNQIAEVKRFIEEDFATVNEYKINTLIKASKEISATLAGDGNSTAIKGILEIIPRNENDEVYLDKVKKFEFDLKD